jgi:P-type conjugative transfer protein TrbJ
LAYSLGNLDQVFRSTYPGYGTNPTVYYMNYQRWSQTSLDTTLGALRAAGLQNQQMQSEYAVVNSLQNMSQTADGQMQALNVLGQISDQQVQQLMKQAGVSGRHDPTAGRRSSRGSMVLHRRAGDERRQDIPAGPTVS